MQCMASWQLCHWRLVAILCNIVFFLATRKNKINNQPLCIDTAMHKVIYGVRDPAIQGGLRLFLYPSNMLDAGGSGTQFCNIIVFWTDKQCPQFLAWHISWQLLFCQENRNLTIMCIDWDELVSVAMHCGNPGVARGWLFCNMSSCKIKRNKSFFPKLLVFSMTTHSN